MRFPPFNPYIAVAIGVLSVSTSAIFVKLATEAPAAIIANYRLLLAVLIMAPFIWVKYRHEFKYFQKKDLVYSSLAGVFLAFHFILWFESLNYTSVASSVVLVTLQPVFVTIGTSLFVNERLSPGAVTSMFIALFGSFIISWGDFQLGPEELLGDILALLGAIMITVYFLFGQDARKRISLMPYTFIVYSVSSITLIVYNLILQYSFLGYLEDHWWIFFDLTIFHSIFVISSYHLAFC